MATERGTARHTRRRQWGSDRRDRPPLPVVPVPVSERRITVARAAIVITITAWLAYVIVTVIEQFVEGKASTARLGIEAIVYLLLMTALTASAIAYLITRIGFFYRSRSHHRTPRAALDEFLDGVVPTVTVLVPSYKEDERVIRTTLLSAALQEHPHLRVVLLIDDPPAPTRPADQRLLQTARDLPRKVEAELAVPLKRVLVALEQFEAIQIGDRQPTVHDMRVLASHYEFAAGWLRGLGARQEIVDHADAFFVDHVLGALATDLATIGDALTAGAEAGAALPTERLLQLYRRLVATFRAELSSYERKQYVSSSHEANKAMNLNSYIALMGGSFQEVTTPLGRALVPCAPRHAEVSIPDPDYVLTLDADSVLLPEYCVRILYLMEQGRHAKVGVAQTPYSAYPGSATRIERIAGATTDLQHIVHQGMTHYDATFWVGANAILRKRALDEICEVDYVEHWEIKRYIQDRTVIEDTESTIDLGIHGWSLFNYPERLAYSATPPDFGSLCIQRQRWANGGLLILPKLRQQMKARRSRGEKNRFGEIFLRVNYMASIFWASLCLLVLLIYPFNAGLLKPILPLMALPYFLMMATDLKYCGYKRLDVLRIYGFNLILLPVNLSGTFASILQLITGVKSSFKRTPKVRDRTTAGFGFILAPIALIVFASYQAVLDIRDQHWTHLFFAALNAVLAAYAIVAFVGVGNALVDLWVQLRGWLYRPVEPKRAAARNAPSAVATTSGAIGDWASVLHYRTSSHAHRSVTTRSIEGEPAGDEHDTRRPTDAGQPFAEYTFFTVFQPIADLGTNRVAGYEALTRFADGQPFAERLAAASSEGIGAELDAELALAALAAAHSLPEGSWLSINVSAALAAHPGKLAEILGASPCQLVIDIGSAPDPDALANGPLGQLPGVLLAVDDTGANYESLALIERLQPSFLKLHRDAVTGIEHDAARQTFVRTLVEFADRLDCQIIAEGIETEAEHAALRDAGVHLGQGYFVGRPTPVGQIS